MMLSYTNLKTLETGWESEHGMGCRGENEGRWYVSATKERLDWICREGHSWPNQHIFC